MDWGVLLKDLAPVVAIVVLFYFVLRGILSWIVQILADDDKETVRQRETLHDLASAIKDLTRYLRTQRDEQQLRQDRNMLVNLDRFDDLEYLIEGIMPNDQKDRFLILAERRQQREAKYAKFLSIDNVIEDDRTL